MKAILEQNANVVFMVNLNNLFLVSLSVMVGFILKIVPDCKKGTLQALILGRVDANSIIYSEAFVAIMA